ncbi:DUF2520 domain-containing protein [Alkalibaculum sp. M08DMB]|uniref:DUF2520 domain-containing protein n=1 Tax=Alkalibaculum sporogenes TaxID=2655001 RepID=A0A6A7K8N7_9FIRM|nr:Rossmann-like and DUF2520 domain-containing protein [Alkalibaculum sporogenes]MPW25766.1 DUF2520 domain-containing protein [Alkalibaculum sporogenes]
MKIGFIGSGVVGMTLGQYFKNNKLNVVGYYSRNINSAIDGANRINGTVFTHIEQIINEVDIIFITTNDDSIVEVASDIADIKTIRKNHIFIHTSGVHSTEAFQVLKQFGCGLYSMHPLQAFADSKEAIKHISNTHFTIEGNGINMANIIDLLEVIKNPYNIIEKDKNEIYHAGACVISNYLVTLLNMGFDLIESAGYPREDIYSAFAPLILSTLDNIENRDTKKSLTGPINRGDINTIAKHLNALEFNVNLEFYKYMGLKTLDMIEMVNSLDEKKKEIKNMLMEG